MISIRKVFFNLDKTSRISAWHLVVLLLVFQVNIGLAQSAENPPVKNNLPDPLTLEAAFKSIDEEHPDIVVARAGLSSAKALQAGVEADSALRASLEARLQWIDPVDVAPDQNDEDHRLALFVDKTLYDFGRSDSLGAAAQKEVVVQEVLLEEARQHLKLKILQQYFDVLLADIRFFRDNEEMATKFVALDKLRDRRELGQVSDLEVAEQETVYQKFRQKRRESEALQRITRTRLAIGLNRPREVPANLAAPKLDLWDRQLPEVETLQEEAVQNNRSLRILRQRLLAARERVSAARAGKSPTLKGQVEAYAWEREIGSRDNWRAGVVLEVPLLDGGNTDASVAKALAEVYDLEAKLSATEQAVRLDVLEQWFHLDALRVQRDGARAELDYRELYLDLNRALYEMEAQATIGDAMSKISNAQLQSMRTEFENALTWARLDLVLGRKISFTNQDVPKQP